jgi:hypothetical protein
MLEFLSFGGMHVERLLLGGLRHTIIGEPRLLVFSILPKMNEMRTTAESNS